MFKTIEVTHTYKMGNDMLEVLVGTETKELFYDDALEFLSAMRELKWDVECAQERNLQISYIDTSYRYETHYFVEEVGNKNGRIQVL